MTTCHSKEIWKDIQGYEGIYQVSSYGRVKSFKKNKVKILKPQMHYKGYKFVTLHKNGIGEKCKVHRLVAKAFIPNPNNYPVVNHKDENKSNNNVENLEWCSDEKQQREAFRLGLKKKVGKYLSNELIHIIYDMYFKETIKPKKISLIVGFPFGTIRKICYGERCKDLYREYRAKYLCNNK